MMFELVVVAVMMRVELVVVVVVVVMGIELVVVVVMTFVVKMAELSVVHLDKWMTFVAPQTLYFS